MLRARITVDLPSTRVDEGKRRGPRKFDVPVEELTTAPLSIVKGVYGGFAAAGITDVLSFLVDQEVIFVDFRGIEGDLEAAFAATLDKGVHERPFNEMQLVMSCRGANLHVLFDLIVRHQVPLGEPELIIDVAARPDELRVRPGERADAYAARVAAWSAAGFLVEAQRHALDALVSSLAAEIARRLVCESVVAEQARVEVVHPDGAQIAGFAKLKFESSVAPVTCRPLPPARRTPDEDPYSVYYDDPYWGFTCWLLVDHMVRHQHWASPEVWIVDRDGYQLATGDDLGDVRDDWRDDALWIDASVVATDAVTAPARVADDRLAEQWLSEDAPAPTRSERP